MIFYTPVEIQRRGGFADYLEKLHTEFGIVALAHNLLKVARIRLAMHLQKQAHKKAGRKTMRFLAQPFYFWCFPNSAFVL
ncbi:hypothetical protein BBD42_03585 [Paenibacillus sp. BIHB 4019]|uniref:Transposase DDE domain-containing protein n=1 Tax=Paenibacillus sp. BIHB 4019 TaxID=1870819 RepID=A0A1B2DD81_9BACL|nr:hypothetical protein BBD42_03585 [Paenibacillus sp. BIHB 4019]